MQNEATAAAVVLVEAVEGQKLEPGACGECGYVVVVVLGGDLKTLLRPNHFHWSLLLRPSLPPKALWELVFIDYNEQRPQHPEKCGIERKKTKRVIKKRRKQKRRGQRPPMLRIVEECLSSAIII